MQALASDPDRERRDLVDIELLAERYSGDIDWERMREYFALFGRLGDWSSMRGSDNHTIRLTAAEKAELLALVGSDSLREDLRAIARLGEADNDEYISFATSVAELSNHARPPFRPMTGSFFKL